MKKILGLILLVASTSFAEMAPPYADAPSDKIPSHPTWSLGFGPAFMSSMNAGGVGIGLEGARAWDVRVASVKAFTTFALRGSAYFGQLGLGVNKFILDQDTSPYVAADLGYGFSKADGGGPFSGQSASGFVIGAGGGVQMFRSADIQFDVGLRFALLLKDTAAGHPSLTFFRVSVLF